MCDDHNTTEWIFVIKSGSCRVLKELVAVHPNVPGVTNLGYSPAPDDSARGRLNSMPYTTLKLQETVGHFQVITKE